MILVRHLTRRAPVAEGMALALGEGPRRAHGALWEGLQEVPIVLIGQLGDTRCPPWWARRALEGTLVLCIAAWGARVADPPCASISKTARLTLGPCEVRRETVLADYLDYLRQHESSRASLRACARYCNEVRGRSRVGHVLNRPRLLQGQHARAFLLDLPILIDATAIPLQAGGALEVCREPACVRWVLTTWVRITGIVKG
mmetsp:Transcript_115403/g.288408  ORF Transcript_115403/g.288408 Transcript_115403/m.288408 type:complete len:201 (-) Transcript_115403:1471-2073(-)